MFSSCHSRLVGQCRRWYVKPALEHLVQGKGVPGLFSSRGLENAWFERADLYTAKLNRFSGGGDETPLETLIYEDARSGVKRNVVNYASLLYNLRFAMSCVRGCSLPMPSSADYTASEILKTPSLALRFSNEPAANGNSTLQNALVSSFGSIVEFRSLLMNSSLAISGDGYTWLMARRPLGHDGSDGQVVFDKLFVVNTYNAGTPFNFHRSGHLDDLRIQYLKKSAQLETVEESSDFSMSKSVEEARQTEAYKKVSYIPLLAIDASPKAWLHDYGVFGKQAYLDRIWESIEWNVVESRLPKQAVSYGLF